MWATRVDEGERVRRHLHEWVDEGLMTVDQAEAIERFEHIPEPALEASGPGLGLASEAAAYVGSLLALLAGAFVMAQAWDEVPVPARILVGAVVTGLGLLGGQIVIRLGDPGSLRLAGFLRAVGAAGAGFAVAVAAVESGAPDWVIGVSVGGVLAGIGLPLWRNLDRPLQMLTVVAGAVAIAIGIGSVVQPPVWAVGATAWLAGLLFGVAGLTERLRPPVLVAGVGAVAMILGASTAYDPFGQAGVFAVLVTSALVVVAGLGTRTVPVLVIGVLALLQSSVQTLAAFVRGAAGLLVLLVVGVATVVIVLGRARRSPPSAAP